MVPHSLKKRQETRLFVCKSIQMRESCQKPSGEQAVQEQEILPSVAVSQQSFFAAKCVWDVLLGWIENPLLRARSRNVLAGSSLSLWDASTSPRGEKRQPEDSTADIPKANQHQCSVPLLPRPCWSRRTRWLMIQAGKHKERPAGSLEDQFITLYFVWPPLPPALVAGELYNTLCTNGVSVVQNALHTHTYTHAHTSQAKKKTFTSSAKAFLAWV